MTLTLELPTEVEQVLAARAQARGVTLPKYLQDLATRDAQAGTQAQARQVLAAPAVGSPEAARAQSAKLRALLAAPAQERAQVLEAQAQEYAAFCETPEGRAEWDEMQPWLNTPGPSIEALEAEDARAPTLASTQARAA